MCNVKELELIGQIIDKNKKNPTNLYNCPKCLGTFIQENRTTYRKVTPRFFINDI